MNRIKYKNNHGKTYIVIWACGITHIYIYKYADFMNTGSNYYEQVC